MPLSSKVFLSVFLLVSLGFASWLIRRELRTPQNEREVMDRVIELMQEGRYQKPVQILPAWIDDPRRDASRDGLLYQEMAIAYIAKANRVARDLGLIVPQVRIHDEIGLGPHEYRLKIRGTVVGQGVARK